MKDQGYAVEEPSTALPCLPTQAPCKPLAHPSRGCSSRHSRTAFTSTSGGRHTQSGASFMSKSALLAASSTGFSSPMTSLCGKRRRVDHNELTPYCTSRSPNSRVERMLPDGELVIPLWALRLFSLSDIIISGHRERGPSHHTRTHTPVRGRLTPGSRTGPRRARPRPFFSSAARGGA